MYIYVYIYVYIYIYTRLCSSLRFAAKSCSRISFHRQHSWDNACGWCSSECAEMETNPSQYIGKLRMAYQ